jgi:hypothetical protein
MGTLRRITRLPTRNFSNVIAPVLEVCTLLDNGEITVPELREQFANALAKRAKCSAAGKLGGERKASSLGSSWTKLRMHSSGQIANKNKNGTVANATPKALASGHIYQDPESKKGGGSPSVLLPGAVSEPMRQALDRLKAGMIEKGD